MVITFLKRDMNYTLEGNLVMASGTTLYVGFTDSQPYMYSNFTVSENSTINYATIQVHNESTLINNGSIIALSGYGNFKLVSVKEGFESEIAKLENNNLIQIDSGGATMSFMDYSQFTSGENGRIIGDAKCETNNNTQFFIANVNGLDEANQLTGTHTCHGNGLNITFNGTKPQKTGTTLPLLRNVVFDNPYGVELQTDVTVFANDGSVTVVGGTTLDVGNHIIKTSNLAWGYATFYLKNNATIITQNSDGLSSHKTSDYISSGSIQLNYAVYSSGANYKYNGTGVQHTGCFDTTPIPDTVNDLTADDSNGLTQLIFCPDRDLNITGIATGTEYFSGNFTLPVTLANLHLQQTPQGFPQLNWLTASETNCMGFYVWRAQDLDLGAAMRVSTLIEAVNTSQGAAYAWTDAELDEDGTYYYWLEDISFNQETAFHGPRMITVSFNAGQSAPEITQATGLKKAYPNPFNPHVWLNYYIAKNSTLVTLDFYNQRGQRVDSIQLSNQPKGSHTLRWNTEGLNLPSGIYYVRFTDASSSNMMKVVLSK